MFFASPFRQAFLAVGLLLTHSPDAIAELFYTAYPNSGVSRIDEATGREESPVALGTGYRQGFDDYVGLTFGPDRLLYVSARNYDGSRYGRWGVFRFDPKTGDFLGTLVNGGSLNHIAFGPEGDLYGSYGTSGHLIRYDGVTGQSKGIVLRGDDFGYWGVGTFTFLLDGALFAATGEGDIARYDRETGERIGPLTSLVDLGLERYRFDGMAVGPDGNVYVAYNYRARDQILDGGVMRFDSATGSLLDVAISGIPAFGAASGGSLGLAFGPDGDLYVGSQHASAVLRYDPYSGELLGSLPIAGNFMGASYLAFTPIPEPSAAAMAFTVAIIALARSRRLARHATHLYF